MDRKPTGFTGVDRVGEHGSSKMYDLGCRCAVCRMCRADRTFEYRLRAKLEKLRDELDLEDWEIELERIALEIKHFLKRRAS